MKGSVGTTGTTPASSHRATQRAAGDQISNQLPLGTDSEVRAGEVTGMHFWGKAKQVKLMWATDPTSCWVFNKSLGKEEPSEETCLDAKSVGVSERNMCRDKNSV